MEKDLIILLGGESRERLVSVATAQNMSEALPSARCWFWARDDSIYKVNAQELRAHQDVFKTEFKPKSAAIFKTILEALDSEKAKDSVFVLATHGGRGEDGTLQAWLEERGIAHTGPSSKACRLAMDKAAAKSCVSACGVRVADSLCLSAGDAHSARLWLEKQFQQGAQKVAMKPNFEGSSVGFLVVTPQTLEEAVRQINSHSDRPYLLEAFVGGVELTVGVYDDAEGTHALIPTELRAQHGFADYDGKYLGLGTQEITPAEVSDEVIQAAQHMAVSAHQALGCEGYSRTDMMVDALGPVYLETNSLPGMTRASLVPQALAYEGISVKNFLEQQVEFACERLKRSL